MRKKEKPVSVEPCSVWIGRFRNREECGEPKSAREKYFFQWRLFLKEWVIIVGQLDPFK